MGQIGFEEFIKHGKIETNVVDGVMELQSLNSITSVDFNLAGDCYKRHYLSFPGKYKLPLQIDMTIKLDYPTLIMLVGSGHIIFNSSSNHKLEDIIKPSGKPNQDGFAFDNNMPDNEFVKIIVIYNLKEMQILINGEERFYSNKLPYMKAKNLQGVNAEGLSIGLAITKLSTLCIKSIEVTEHEQDITILHKEVEAVKSIVEETAKPSFENVIATLPQEYEEEVKNTDNYLKSLKTLKFKRAVDKSGTKITYLAADFGVSYIMKLKDHRLVHSFSWYIITSGKPETWHRKADYMEMTLESIAKENLPLAERIFYALNDCVGCYGARCLVKTPYTFQGQKRIACHGVVMLRMCHQDMQDARDFFGYFSKLMEDMYGIEGIEAKTK